MHQNFKQLPLNLEMMGLCATVATTKMLPVDFERKFKIDFEDGYDNLDYFKGAKIQIDERYFELINYFRSSVSETCIVVMSNSSFQQQAKDLRKFLDTFGLTKYDLTWVHPEIDFDSI